MLIRAGAGAFGMSTVPEILAAAHVGLQVVVLSMITNLAASLQDNLNHKEVFEEAKKAGPGLQKLVSSLVRLIDTERASTVSLSQEVVLSGLEAYDFANPVAPADTSAWVAGAVEKLKIANSGFDAVEGSLVFIGEGNKEPIHVFIW